MKTDEIEYMNRLIQSFCSKFREEFGMKIRMRDIMEENKQPNYVKARWKLEISSKTGKFQTSYGITCYENLNKEIFVDFVDLRENYEFRYAMINIWKETYQQFELKNGKKVEFAQ